MDKYKRDRLSEFVDNIGICFEVIWIGCFVCFLKCSQTEMDY